MLTLLVAFPVALAVVLLPGFAFASMLRSWGIDEPSCLAAVPIGSTIASYLVFLGFSVGPVPGLTTSIALHFAAAVWLVLRSRVRSAGPSLIVAGLSGVIALSLAALRGIVDPAQGIFHAAAVRFWASADNKIPVLVAERLRGGGSLTDPILDGWLLSDRPPAAYGFLLARGDLLNSPNVDFAWLVAAAVLWTFPAAAWLQQLGISPRRRFAALTTISLCFGVVLNEIYTWPKLIAGTLTMSALVLALAAARRQRSNPTVVLAVTAAVVALLCHGSSLFVLPAIVVLLLSARPTPRSMAIAALVGAALYAPWLVFQTVVNPPGNRLVYWHLAGTSITRPDERGVLTAIVEEYRRAGPAEVLANKVRNLTVLLFDVGPPNAATDRYGSGFGKLRYWQSSTLPGAVFPLIALAAIPPWRRNRSPAWRGGMVFLIVSTIVFCVAEWGGNTPSVARLHTAPLGLVLVLAGLLATRLESLSRWVVSAIGVALAVYLLAFWGFGHDFASGAFSLGTNGAAAVTLVGSTGLLLALAAMQLIGESDRPAVTSSAELPRSTLAVGDERRSDDQGAPQRSGRGA